MDLGTPLWNQFCITWLIFQRFCRPKFQHRFSGRFFKHFWVEIWLKSDGRMCWNHKICMFSSGFALFRFPENWIIFSTLFDCFLMLFGYLGSFFSVFWGLGTMLKKYRFFKVGQRDPRIQSTTPGDGKNDTSWGPNLQPPNYKWQMQTAKWGMKDAGCKEPCRWNLEDANTMYM